MRRVLLLAAFTGLFHVAWSQKNILTGQLLDSASSPVPSATVMLMLAKDSTLAKFAVTNGQGLYELRGVERGDYFLKVSYLGFAPYSQAVSVSGSGQVIDLGRSHLQPVSRVLGEVTIESEAAPVVVKKDTIEFNAGSFKTKVNATAEDLIKKLPGMEVDPDGTIRAQGEQVQRVMVDGKEFFGQDPKLATRNLPADAVDKVQVYDKKSDQAVFTGVDDGQKEKTINLELKEEKRHAAFGNNTAGIGTEHRFQAKASINRFEKGNQLSFLGMGNNINEQGFSIGEYANFNNNLGGAGGGGGRITIQIGGNNQGGPPINMGRQNGVVTNYAAGVNTNQSFDSDKIRLHGSYFYNRLDQDLISRIHRVNYVPGGEYNFDQDSRQNTISNNHRADMTFEQKLDSSNFLKANVNALFTNGEQTIHSQGETWNIGNTEIQNRNIQNSGSASDAATLNSNLLLRHRFHKKGRSASANFEFGYTTNHSTGNLQSVNEFLSGTPSVEAVNQQNAQTTESPSYGVTLTYTEPLGGRKYLEASYHLSTDVNRVTREVYDILNEQRIFNDSLSTNYNSAYRYSRPGLNFRINREKFNLTAGTAYQQSRLQGEWLSRNETIDRNFDAVLPAVHLNYDFTGFRHLRLDYTTDLQEPTIQQLQPVLNNSDQLNQNMGNPLLRPAYAHQLSTNFTLFNPSSFVNFFAFINGNYTSNAIVNSQSTTPDFVRITIPVNVRYSASVTGNFNLGIPVKALNSRFSLGPAVSVASGINLTNLVENKTVQHTRGGTLRYNYSLNEILIVDLSTTLSRQDTKYSFDTRQNQTYLNQTWTAEVNLNFLKNYAFNTEMNYYVYDSKTNGFHETLPLWNLSVSRYLLKNNAGELRIGVNNLLDKSQSFTQTATTNYLLQQTTNNLGRFFMVSFTYALNKQLNPMGGMKRGGGMRMIITN